MLAIVHTSYSLQTGVCNPEHWASTAAERGYRALAVADKNGLYGAVKFYRAVKAAGLKPLTGTYLQLDSRHWCNVLITSRKGYRQCCELLSARHLDSGFDIQNFSSDRLDHLLFLSRSPSALLRILKVVPRENVYALCPISAQPPDAFFLRGESALPSLEKAFIPEAWFLETDDRITFDCLYRLRKLRRRESCPSTEQYDGIILPDAGQWTRRHRPGHTVTQICERCNFEFVFGRPLLPHISLPSGKDAAAHLTDLCRTKLSGKYSSVNRLDAKNRLDKELRVIIANGFADYFLYVNEIIDFAKRNGISAGVRGSAASCITAYLLDFTRCCPLEHDLYFERFMNPGRKDCPDIDIDIADNRRDEVIAFCYRRWGEDHVAMVTTVQKYRTRSALRDAAGVLGIPSSEVTALLERGGLVRACPELLQIADRLKGLPRHLGVHCGGMIITPCPLTHVTALARANKGVVISHYEKDQAEAIGLVKMDLLGNSALSVITRGKTLLKNRGELLPKYLQQTSGPVSLPAFDYKTARTFAKGDTLGVYQCESPGMRQICRALRPRTVKDVAAALSLIRPGPAAAGMKEAFIRRKRGIEDTTYLHPGMAAFLATTYGVMLFQEDVMKVAVNLAGYSMADADALRRTVSGHTDKTLFENERHRFVFRKARNAGINKDTAEKIWHQVARFASYAYCKAHASVYGRLAWITAAMKSHYPREFYTAILNCHKSMYPARVFVWDAIRHGVPVYAPEINASQIDWTVAPKGIQAGFGIVRGVSSQTCRELLRERRTQPFRDLRDLLSRVYFKKGELRRLILIESFRVWGSREKILHELRDIEQDTAPLPLFPEKYPDIPPVTAAQLAFTQIPFRKHPVECLTQIPRCQAVDMHKFIGTETEMIGILNAVKHTRTKGTGRRPEQQMGFITLEDSTGVFDAVLFPEAHREYGHIFSHLGPYRIRGTVTQNWNSPGLELKHVELL